jgi:hypothetical protein
MSGTNYLNLIKHWNGSEDDDRLTYQDLFKGLSPTNSIVSDRNPHTRQQSAYDPP